MHISVRKHLACCPLEEEFKSLLCTPLKDGNSPSKQAPQSDMKMLWWDFLIGPIHDEGSDGISVIQDSSVLNIISLWEKAPPTTIFQDTLFNIMSSNVPVLSTFLRSSTSEWPKLYCICSWQQAHASPRPALWYNRVSLKIMISHNHPAQQCWKTLLSAQDPGDLSSQSAPSAKVRATGGRSEAGTAITSGGHGHCQSNPLCFLRSAPCRKQSRAEQDACAAQVICPKFTCSHTWTVGSTCLDNRDVRSVWVQSNGHWLKFFFWWIIKIQMVGADNTCSRITENGLCYTY